MTLDSHNVRNLNGSVTVWIMFLKTSFIIRNKVPISINDTNTSLHHCTVNPRSGI